MSAGIQNQIMFALESTWGDAESPAKGLEIQPGDGIQTDVDIQFVSGIAAKLAKNHGSYKGKQKHEGEYEFDFIPGNVGYLLKSLFGGLSSGLKAGETLVYEHSFSESATKPSLTIEQAVGDLVRQYAGSIVTGLKLACKAGETLRATASIKAKTNDSTTKTTFSGETLRPFNFNDCLQASGFKIGSDFYSQVENFELEYKNNGEMVHALGSNDPTFFYVKASEVSGKFELYLDSTTAGKYADYLSKVEQALAIAFAGDAIGDSSNYKLDITVPKSVFKVANFPVAEDYNLLSVEFEGLYDTATSKLITAKLTNLTENYT